jgi:aspartate-semialdehyde dehydrogenase
LVMSLAPLDRAFGLEKVLMTSMQAVSGAGYPGVPTLDILANVIPFIGGEEEKVERETRKLLGQLVDGQVKMGDFAVSAHCNRVLVEDGHTETISMALKTKATIRDRPQPKFDLNVEHGMATVVGRVRECPVLQYKYVALSHNTIRGAAGAALLNAELMKSEGYLD